MTTLKNTIEITSGSHTVIVNTELFVAIKSADSYYKSSIQNAYFHEMHDTRGMLNVFSSEQEALNQMTEWAKADLDLNYYDDEIFGDESKPKGYDGEGLYDSDWNKFDDKISGYEDDLRSYGIRPLHEELQEMADKGKLYECASAAQDIWFDKSAIKIIDLQEEEE